MHVWEWDLKDMEERREQSPTDRFVYISKCAGDTLKLVWWTVCTLLLVFIVELCTKPLKLFVVSGKVNNICQKGRGSIFRS